MTTRNVSSLNNVSAWPGADGLGLVAPSARLTGLLLLSAIHLELPELPPRYKKFASSHAHFIIEGPKCIPLGRKEFLGVKECAALWRIAAEMVGRNRFHAAELLICGRRKKCLHLD